MTSRTSLEQRFIQAWQKYAPIGAPMPLEQFYFAPGRRYRADFAFPDQMLLVEIDGGTYKPRSGHSGGPAYTAKCLRDYTAMLNGWRVLRLDGPILRENNGEEAVKMVASLLSVSTSDSAPEPTPAYGATGEVELLGVYPERQTLWFSIGEGAGKQHCVVDRSSAQWVSSESMIRLGGDIEGYSVSISNPLGISHSSNKYGCPLQAGNAAVHVAQSLYNIAALGERGVED